MPLTLFLVQALAGPWLICSPIDVLLYHAESAAVYSFPETLSPIPSSAVLLTLTFNLSSLNSLNSYIRTSKAVAVKIILSKGKNMSSSMSSSGSVATEWTSKLNFYDRHSDPCQVCIPQEYAHENLSELLPYLGEDMVSEIFHYESKLVPGGFRDFFNDIVPGTGRVLYHAFVVFKAYNFTENKEKW